MLDSSIAYGYIRTCHFTWQKLPTPERPTNKAWKLYRWKTSTVSPARREFTVICGPEQRQELTTSHNNQMDLTWHHALSKEEMFSTDTKFRPC